MNAKRVLTTEEAMVQLEDAIAADSANLASEIKAIREKISKLLRRVSPDQIGSQVKKEASLLAGLFEEGDDKTRSKTVKTDEKVDFLRKQLKSAKNGKLKTELLEAAALEFGVDPAPTFLDAAIKEKDFRTEGKGKGNPVTVYLS